MFSRKEKTSKVKVTVELDAELATALETLARKSNQTLSQRVGYLLHAAVWDLDRDLLPNLAPPLVRLVDTLLSESIDAGVDALRLTKTPNGVVIEHEKDGQMQVVREQRVGDSEGRLPRHLQRPLFDRLEKMAGVRLRSREAQATARVLIVHNGQNHDLKIGYEENFIVDSGESLTVRFR